MSTVRIPPLPVEEWSAEMTSVIEEFRAAVRAGASVDGARNSRKRQSGVHTTGVLARYPALAKAFLTFNGHILYGTTLSARHRELMILRIAARRRCAYEWAQHVLLAADAGITAAEVSRVVDAPDSPEWAPVDRALLAAVDELIADARVGDATWHELARAFDERQLMDIVFTVGTYELLAMTLRSFGVEPEAELLPHLPPGW